MLGVPASSVTVTLYSVPIPVLVTVPSTFQLNSLPLTTLHVGQFFATDMEHTGKAPKRKSFRTAVGDCEDRVSSRKLAKQGTFALPNAWVMSSPPSKNNGEARVPPL